MTSDIIHNLEPKIGSSVQNDTDQLVDVDFIVSLFNLDSTNIQSLHCINDPQTASVSVH